MSYEAEYHGHLHKNLINNKKYYLFRAKVAEKNYWKYLKGKVLEFGCGVGQNIYLHKDRAVGFDISRFSIKECEKRWIRTGNSIRNKEFDSILVCHVLEHMENPTQTLKEIYEVLKIEGRLVLILPVAEGNKPKNKFKPDKSGHLFMWNFGSANELLNFVGFKIVKNEFNYAYGYSIFYRLPFLLSFPLLKFMGHIRNKKEMIIIASK